MKRFLAQMKQPRVQRAVLTKVIVRVLIGLAVCLLWDRFLNSDGQLSILGHAFMAVGLLLAAFAWLRYLRLDGIRIFPARAKPAPKRRASGSMTDDLDEEPDAEALDGYARGCAALAADLCAAILFIIPSLFA